jgi:hypothetical protein
MEITSLDKSQTIGSTTAIVSEAQINNNAERIALVITNTSTGGQVISLASSGQAVAGSGLVLSPGGSMVWTKNSNWPIVQSRVQAISSAANGTIAVHEEVLQK